MTGLGRELWLFAAPEVSLDSISNFEHIYLEAAGYIRVRSLISGIGPDGCLPSRLIPS
jgi:hypothetical protein